MTPRRYSASTTRDCLRRVKEELGADAVVLSSRSLPGRVEMIALPLDGLEEMATYTPRGAGSVSAAAPSGTQRALLQQLEAIKTLLERQLTGLAWNEMGRAAPLRKQLLCELAECGFSAPLARELVAGIDEDAGLTRARATVRDNLDAALLTGPSDSEIVNRGGVVALVGPTGVGKSTTTAKLAARCVLRYGADSLGLITTDSYRIGAHEQLKIYGRILGAPVLPVRNRAELQSALSRLQGKHMVLIDTPGVSQRDPRLTEQAALLQGGRPIQRLLLLNAAARGDTLNDVVAAHGAEGLAGCILTKLDEAALIAPALDVVVRHRLKLLYLANGQQVPEDLHVPNRSYLLHRVFKRLPEDSSHRLRADEAGLWLACGSARAPAAYAAA